MLICILIKYILIILAADDEISFDPDDVITHIEMVSVFIILLYKNYRDNLFFIFFRLMKVGGVDIVKDSTVYSLQITLRYNK